MPTPTPFSEIAWGFFRDVGLLLGRLLAAWSIVIFHAWGEAIAGYRHFFGPKEAWSLSVEISRAGLPAALPLAVALTVALWAVAVAFSLGLLTRVAALVLVLISAVVPAVIAIDQVQESSAAYAAVALILLFAGAGRISLDGLIRSRRTPKPQPKYR
jgi:uncharacterized membrane protein YphA (DoxX/SURF4 family)